MSGKSARLSIVIPAFNEEGNIGRLIEETYAAVPKAVLGEVIVVDDASDDRTGAEIKALIPPPRNPAVPAAWAPRGPERGSKDRRDRRALSGDRRHGR